MKRIIKFLDERQGIRSLIRLQSLVLFIFSLILISYQVFADRVYIGLDILLITASFVPKALQKFPEMKYGQKTDLENDNTQLP